MSLQVWLPLNGDLHNLGLTNIDFITSGVTFADGGKIGQKYLSAGTITIPAIKSKNIFNNNNMSFAFWIYPIGTSGSGAIMGQTSMATGDNRMYTIYQYSTPNDLHLSWQNETATNSSTFLGGIWSGFFPANTWTHCCITYNGSVATIYRNGEKYATANGTQNRQNFEYNFPINGNAVRKLNDVRIYNHCLSPKEVEEISKGLVLHYKLDNNGMGNPNLLKGNYHVTTTSTSSNPIGSLSLDTSLISLNDLIGKTLYFSYDYSVEGNRANNTGDYTKDRYGIHGTLNYITSSGTTSNNYPFAGFLEARGTGRAVQSFTIPANAQSISTLSFAIQAYNKPADPGITWYIKNCKLEIENATPYTPNPSDLNLDTSIIYDSSGYNNNGEIINNLQIISDSPRYSAATNLATTSSHIHISNLSVAGFSNSYTFTWWGNCSTYSGKMMWGFSDGVRLNGIYNGNLWNTGDGSNNPLYTPGTTTQVSAPSVNVWHHFAMVGNGTQCLVYLDGILWGQAKTYKTISGTSIYFNGWLNNTDYTLANTKLSDFRIYSTALTAEQIKELYNTSKLIDNQGNKLAREVNSL